MSEEEIKKIEDKNNNLMYTTLDNIKDVLKFLDCDYYDNFNEWIKTGMAIKNIGDLNELNENDCFNLWNEWSKQSSKYDYEYL